MNPTIKIQVENETEQKIHKIWLIPSISVFDTQKNMEQESLQKVKMIQ